MQDSRHLTWQRTALLVLLALLVMRVVLMYYIPLTDTTEARYAEIARKMLETGNWVTPLHDYGVPFWAKPPLSTWLSASAMGLFGQNALAARLPSLLVSLATLWLTFDLARRHSGRDAATAATLFLAGGLLFFIAAGSVMTDPAFLFCVTLSQVAFWHAMRQPERLWRYLFFVGLGLGLLAKGPLALVLAGLPIFFWVLLRKQWQDLWHNLPWITGSLLMLVIALPWYLLAEARTPGFLDYFIMGENVHRFLDPGWHGDKYGFAHNTPHGLIWLYALGALFPWSIAMLVWLFRQRHQLSALLPDQEGWLLYLCLWTVMTPLFFSLSGHIIFPYSLPMLPGCALLFAELWSRARSPSERSSLPWIAASTGALFGVLLLLNALSSDQFLRTQKAVIAAWQHAQPTQDSALVYWDSRREFSAEFYSAGRAKTTHDAAQLEQLTDHPSRDYLVLNAADRPQLPAELLARFEQVASIPVRKDHILLLRERNGFRTSQVKP
ncbi:glycosyltransferase family 39 protein [Pseudomonas cavernicola]|uniref:Glycosyltransferase family 39 protein n=1 Tax=Pseudomonas cavernicola TaxID=2320866 RepID=A0A418XLL3_9PSED|nr:glycosyltransferase family 39 protein [Pseudomonas cavernicola]RJG13335.1 glycosyltransferase family 39 protein [Pseudomonas cavernicola]